MIKINKGDYFDYPDEGEIKRLVSYSDTYNEHYCHAVDINDLDSAGCINKIYIVDFDNVPEILGNINSNINSMREMTFEELSYLIWNVYSNKKIKTVSELIDYLDSHKNGKIKF